MKNTLFILALLFSFLQLKAQSKPDSLVSLQVSDLLKLFSEANYKPIQFSDTNLYVLRHITRNDTAVEDYKSNYLEKKKELLEKDYGLNFTGSYLENFNSDIADLNDNLVYNRKFQAGINWQILKNGYFDNQVKIKLLNANIEREKIKNEGHKQAKYYLRQFDETIFIFNKLKLELLESREVSLLKQYELIKNLVLIKKLPKQDLIRIETRLAEISSLKNVYASYNNYLNYESDTVSLNSQNLPLIDLDYATIFKTIELQTSEILTNDAFVNYYEWYHHIGLKTYVKYNFYDLVGANNRDYFSAGLNLTIPLPINTKLRKEVAHEKWKYDNEQVANNRQNVHEEVLNVAYEFRYKLKQFIGFYQKRQLIEEKLRIEKVKIRLGDNNIDPMGGLDLVDDIVRVDIELIDLLQNLYLKSIKIKSKVAYAKIDDIVKNESITSVNEFSKAKPKGLYIWTKTFANYSSEFLAEYAIYNQFNKVIVSAFIGDTLQKEKSNFGEFLKSTTDYYLMIGSNKLFYDKNITDYIQTVYSEYDSNLVKGIHLDIEPHTFESWKTDRDSLLTNYLTLVKNVSEYCQSNQLKLEISIPLYYDSLIVNELFENVDKIVFMAYENVKSTYIAKKINRYTKLNLNKIEIALRTEDFDNRIEMEQKTRDLSELTQVKVFTFHDLTRLIELDKQSLNR